MGVLMAELLVKKRVSPKAAGVGLRLAWRGRPGQKLTMRRVRQIALKELELNLRTYKRALVELEAAGWIAYRAPTGTAGGELIVVAVEKAMPEGHRVARFTGQGEMLLPAAGQAER